MSEFSTRYIQGRERLILSLLLEEAEPDAGQATRDVSSKIGPYVLLEPQGENRAEVTWLARQEQPFQREVVLKLMKAGMDSRQDVALFSLERQALAAMDHPGIVALLDIGVTLDGRPYFVIEHVAGRSFAELSGETSVTWQEKLELFNQACLAVAHAHGRGIIHLDLQPANIMVTEAGGKLLSKITNFSGARTLPRQWWGDLAPAQGYGPRSNSRFNAPELLAGGSCMDQRCDVYSMGVILHELLTGSKFPGSGASALPPHDCQDLPAALWDIVRQATAPNPEERPESISVLLASLAPLAEKTVCPAEDGSS
jgi:serine/threonine protein kinase